AGAELEHGDRLVDPAEHGVVLLEDLHEHARAMPLGLQERLRVVEVSVGVIALADLVRGEAEHVGREALAGRSDRHEWSLGRATGSGRWRALGAQDLVHGGPADLKLALVRLARADRALELIARAPQCPGQPGLRVALG